MPHKERKARERKARLEPGGRVTFRGKQETPEETKKRREGQISRFNIGGVDLSREEYITAQRLSRGRTGGIGERTPAVEEALKRATPQARKLTEETERREEFEEVTGAGELTEELERKKAAPPSLAPPPLDLLTTPNEWIASREFQPLGITGVSASKQLLEDPKGQLKRAGVELAIGASVGGLSLGALSQLAARATMVTKVLGSKGIVTALSVATTGLGIFVVGPGVFDYRGDEMETHRKIVQGVIEVGERIEAANRNSDPITAPETIELLTTISSEVDRAEQRIKELGIYNVQYRFAKEYLDDMDNIRSARIALLRRIDAVVNTAATGQAAFRPEELLFDVTRFKEWEGKK